MEIHLKRLAQIFDNTPGKGIAVIGDLMLDTYISGTATRLSQEAPVPVLHVKKKEVRLGGAANVIRNLTALAPECRVYSFGIVGNDQPGITLRNLLVKGGADANGVLVDPSRRTTEKQRVIAGNQQVIRMDFEETLPVCSSLLEQLAENVKQLIRERCIQAVIFEDYAKGLLQKQMMQEIVDLAGEYQIFTSLDPHPGHPMGVQHISLMTPNRAEAFGLAGTYYTDPAETVLQDMPLRGVARKVIEKWQPESLLITLGPQGMALFPGNNPDQVLAIPTIAREVYDVSGAGDTVIATYTLCKAAGAATEEAAVISNHAAGIVVGKAGTATTDFKELKRSFTSFQTSKEHELS